MIFDNKEILNNYKWLKQKNRPMIISSNYDGLFCAALLNHHLNWNLVGYYNQESLWISQQAIEQKEDIIWVDLNILPKQGKAVGGHIVSVDGFIPKGFESSCNPNILDGLTANSFESKFPFSTLIFLLWLYDIKVNDDKMSKLLILNTDATWLKWQNYNENCNKWMQKLSNYNFDSLFKNVNTKSFDNQIDKLLYPTLLSINAMKEFGKLKSKFLNIVNKELIINPDWDQDSIMILFELISNHLNWNVPKLPKIIKRIDGEKNKCALKEVKAKGIDHFIKNKNIFSYAITNPHSFSYTTFGRIKKRILDAKP
tara:strand:+ start:31 stop:966 length:936 start_codon:yes stop_codon:yes gene_type:complete